MWICGACLREFEEKVYGVPGWTDVQEWGAVAKVGLKPRGKFKEWYQEEAWHDVLTSLKEAYDIDEKDIIYVKFVENTTRRFAYYLMVVFKKGGMYHAGPLFGKYSHAPNMKSIKAYSNVDTAMEVAGAQVEKKEQDRGYTPVTSFVREQYAATENKDILIAGLAILAGALGYFLLWKKR
jgi:hypothetical protein